MWECELDYYRMDVAIHSTEGQWLTEWKSGLQKHFKFILIFIQPAREARRLAP